MDLFDDEGDERREEREAPEQLDIDRALREEVQHAKLEAEEAAHRARIDPQNEEKTRKARQAREAYEGLRDHLARREQLRNDGLPF